MQTLSLTAPTVRPFGQRVGKLTRFGETWLNLDDIEALEFNPEDGCGCEINFAGQDGCWHVGIEDADCIRRYFTGFESIAQRVDEACETADASCETANAANLKIQALTP